MNYKLTKKLIIFFLSVGFISAAIYFHYGFFDIVNDIIYSQDKIPDLHKNDIYYFMEEKIIFKNCVAILLSLLSFTFFTININNESNYVKIILIVQMTVVFLSAFRWFLFQGFIIG